MVDSVGATAPYAGGKNDPRYYSWNKRILETWRKKIDAANLDREVILHSCHNGCSTPFNGPTLAVAACNESDPRQRWKVYLNDTETRMAEDPSAGLMHDAGTGLCAGCTLDMHYGGPACGNTAVSDPATGHGLGQQACVPANSGVMRHGQRWNYSASTKMLMNSLGSVLEVLPGNQVVMRGLPCLVTPVSTHFHPASCVPCCGPEPPYDMNVSLPGCNAKASCAAECSGKRTQQWKQGQKDGKGYATMESVGRPGMCLKSGVAVKTPLPDWCSTMNMWRSSTDTVK